MDETTHNKPGVMTIRGWWRLEAFIEVVYRLGLGGGRWVFSSKRATLK